jgi:hypothetical protein
MKIHFLLGSFLVVGTSFSSYNDNEKIPLNGRTHIQEIRNLHQELIGTCGLYPNQYPTQDCTELTKHLITLITLMRMNGFLPNSPEGKREVAALIYDLRLHTDHK